MAPAGSKVTLDPATFMLQNKRLIGCTEGDSVPYEVRFVGTPKEILPFANFIRSSSPV
jgi:tetrahydromethanopterin S-methyltransferase subunit D